MSPVSCPWAGPAAWYTRSAQYLSFRKLLGGSCIWAEPAGIQVGEPQRWRWDGSWIQMCTLQAGLGEGLDWGSQCSGRGLLALGTEVQQVVSSRGVGSGAGVPTVGAGGRPPTGSTPRAAACASQSLLETVFGEAVRKEREQALLGAGVTGVYCWLTKPRDHPESRPSLKNHARTS